MWNREIFLELKVCHILLILMLIVWEMMNVYFEDEHSLFIMAVKVSKNVFKVHM